MAERDVSINVKSSFSSEGADAVSSQTRGVREEFEALVDASDALDESLRQRLGRTLDDVGRRAEGFTAQMGDFSGPLYVDVARQALGAQDIDTATKALMRGYQEDEPTRLLDAVQRELLNARRAGGAQQEGEGGEGGPEPVWNDRLYKHVHNRLERQMPTIENSLVAGRLGQAGRSLDSAENYLEQLRVMSGNTEELKHLGETLAKHRESLDELKNQGGGGGGGGGGGKPPSEDGADWGGMFDSIKDMALMRGLGGAGGLGGMIGKLSKFLGPWGMAATVGGATVGGAALGFNWLENKGDTARDEGLAYLDLGRQLGTSRPMMYDFVTDGFATRQELEALHYTSREAGAFAAQYGIRGADASSVFGDTLSGLKLAHATGADEGSIAGLLGAGARTGIFEPGQAEVFANIMYKAVMDGTQNGIASSETFDVMNGYLGKLSAQGLTGSAEGTAAYMHLLTRLGESGSRSLMGQAGANAADNIIQGMTQTGSPGLEMISLSALRNEDGTMPSAEQLKLTGNVATEYDALLASGNEVLAGRMALEQGEKHNATVLNRLSRGWSNATGGRADMDYLFGQEFNLSMEQVANLRHGDPLQPGAGSMFGFMQTPPGAMNEITDLYKTGGIAGIEDPQAEDSFAQRMGYTKERLDFLETEKERLISVTAATQEWVEGIREFEGDITGYITRIAENKDHPGWYEERIQEDRGKRLERQKQEEQEKQIERRETAAEEDLSDTARFMLRRPDDPYALTDHLAAALKIKESNGNYQAVNPDANGPGDPALGAYQILLSNFEGPGGWDKEHLGFEITKDQFLDTPALQDLMASEELRAKRDKLPEGLSEEEQVRRLTGAWYGGNRWLHKDSSEQPKNTYTYEEGGTVYPSISSYGDDVLRLFMQGLPQQEAPAPGPTGAAPDPKEILLRVRLEDVPQALSGLQTAVQEAAKGWAGSRGSPYNQPNRRG